VSAIEAAAKTPIAQQLLAKLDALLAQAAQKVTEIEDGAKARIHAATEPTPMEVA
jgi:hypothetical protein